MPLSFRKRVSIFPAESRERKRFATYPLANSSRKKDRRWPLVIRFWKGSIHRTIALPVTAHAVVAAVVVYVNQQITKDFALPSSIIPSLSIVVGLMLVFRNQLAWARFWGGRNHLSKVTTAVRCLSRQFLVLVPPPKLPGLQSLGSRESLLFPRSSTKLCLTAEGEHAEVESLSETDELKTIETVKILIAMLYTIKNHLRAEWGVALSPGTSLTDDGQETTTDEYKDLLPTGLKGYEHRGLGLTLELATFIEKFIGIGVKKGWFHNAASSSMLSELNSLTASYGSMEVIRLVPIPVAHLIHHKQTLALFCGILPFAMAADMGVWAIPLTAFVAFTLYGIEGIAQTYEDPFGVAKIDINMDDIVKDARQEVEVLLTAWQTQGKGGGGIFRPRISTLPNSDANSEHFSGGTPSKRDNLSSGRHQLRFVVSDLSEDTYKDNESASTTPRLSRVGSAISPGDVGGSSRSYFEV